MNRDVYLQKTMRTVALFVLLVGSLIGAGMVGAAPDHNPTANLIVDVTCEDGFRGDLLIPAFDEAGQAPTGGTPGFIGGEVFGIPRELTITVDGITVFHWRQPGNGFETVSCSFYNGPAFGEVQIQRFK